MTIIETTAPVPWIECSGPDKDGIYSCEVWWNSTTTEIIQTAGTVYKYTTYLAPIFGLLFLIIFILSIYKTIRVKEHRKKWVLISIILLLLVLLSWWIVLASQYMDVVAPWLYR